MEVLLAIKTQPALYRQDSGFLCLFYTVKGMVGVE